MGISEGAVGTEATDDVALAERLKDANSRIRSELSKLIVGQEKVIEQVLMSLFVGGNSLIVGVPGLAKTLLIHTVAQVLDLKFSRIQFTPDLMPSDITGTDIIQEDAEGRRRLVFAPGPVFSNIVLADEINRTPPKTQSALLEAMQEHRVTVQGKSYDLEEPFFVFATQNPIELEGTYPLPEAQLDRFMFEIVIDYLPEDEEVEVVKSTTSIQNPQFEHAVGAKDIVAFQQLVRRVPVPDAVARYAVSLVRASRPVEGAPDFVRKWVSYGGSVRAAPVSGSWWQGPCAYGRPLQRRFRRCEGARAPGSSSSDSAELPCRVRKGDQSRSDRSVVGNGTHAFVGNVVTGVSAHPTHAGFLDPRVLARIDNLELISRIVVDGFINGLHRSPYIGLSMDFAEHRAYMPGDDIRRIDWRLYARTDRFFVKEYEAETNTNFTVLMDISRSMDFGSDGLTKLDYARYLAASLIYFSATQRDRVGLLAFDSEVREFVTPSARHRDECLHRLAALKPGEATDIRRPLDSVTDLVKRRGFIVLISDLYDDPESLAQTLAQLRYRGNDVIVFHVLDPAEVNFDYSEAASYRDLETGETIPVIPQQFAEDYRSMMSAHLEAISKKCGDHQVDYRLVQTTTPLDFALFSYLSERERSTRVK